LKMRFFRLNIFDSSKKGLKKAVAGISLLRLQISS
jgi:hypothetical protein